jgi:hypothetical protein
LLFYIFGGLLKVKDCGVKPAKKSHDWTLEQNGGFNPQIIMVGSLVREHRDWAITTNNHKNVFLVSQETIPASLCLKFRGETMVPFLRPGLSL